MREKVIMRRDRKHLTYTRKKREFKSERGWLKTQTVWRIM